MWRRCSGSHKRARRFAWWIFTFRLGRAGTDAAGSLLRLVEFGARAALYASGTERSAWFGSAAKTFAPMGLTNSGATSPAAPLSSLRRPAPLVPAADQRVRCRGLNELPRSAYPPGASRRGGTAHLGMNGVVVCPEPLAAEADRRSSGRAGLRSTRLSPPRTRGRWSARR